MTRRLRKLLVDSWMVLASACAASRAAGACGVIATETATRRTSVRASRRWWSAPSSPRLYRKMGLTPQEAARVDAMRERCFSSPGGSTPRSRAGRSRNEQLLLIIIILLLLIIII